MAGLQFYVPEGWGEFAYKNFHYSQAVRVGDRIVCSGQGGWDPTNKEVDLDTLIKPDLMDEIDQAFKAVDYNLKSAGGKGWSQVYRITTYSTDIPAQHARIVENLRKWMPDHAPTWTELGVAHLGAPTMNIEIDVEAYDEEGAAKAKAGA